MKIYKLWAETLFERCSAAFDNRERRDSIDPCHRGCAFHRKVWETIGGYPEHVDAGEDTWFNAQWRKMGFKYVLVPEAKQYWRVRKSWTALFRMARRNTKGHVTLGKSRGGKTIAMVTAVYLLTGTFLILGFFNQLMWYCGWCIRIISF